MSAKETSTAILSVVSMGSRDERPNERDALIGGLKRKYDTFLMRVIARNLPCDEDPEDIAQEVYLRIAQRKDAAAITNKKAFLFRTAKNLIIDLARYRKSRERDNFVPITDDICVDETPGPEQVAVGRQAIANLKLALDELPVNCRTAYVLQRVRGMTYNEIAAHMGISVSSVEKHMMMAIAHVMEKMSPALGENSHD